MDSYVCTTSSRRSPQAIPSHAVTSPSGRFSAEHAPTNRRQLIPLSWPRVVDSLGVSGRPDRVEEFVPTPLGDVSGLWQ